MDITVIYYIVGFATWIALVYSVTTFFSRRRYRSEWVETGREWRRKGYDRFIATHDWIQKYFDEGYYEQDRKDNK